MYNIKTKGTEKLLNKQKKKGNKIVTPQISVIGHLGRDKRTVIYLLSKRTNWG